MTVTLEGDGATLVLDGERFTATVPADRWGPARTFTGAIEVLPVACREARWPTDEDRAAADAFDAQWALERDAWIAALRASREASRVRRLGRFRALQGRFPQEMPGCNRVRTG